jgi:hypothetical protein
MLNVHVSVHVHAAHHRYVCMCECVFVCVFVFVCINAGMPDSPASEQYGTGIKKITMPGQVRYRTKPRQSGIFWVQYRNADAGVSFLDADAQLWQLPGNMKKIIALSTLKHLLFKMAVKKEKNYKMLKFPSLKGLSGEN